jgi:hypothetical protein
VFVDGRGERCRWCRRSWPWLLVLPAGYLLVVVPLLVAQATGNLAWMPDL